MICFFSDKLETITIYRSNLIELCNSEGFETQLATLSDIRSMWKVIFSTVLVVSNMRSVLLALCLFWKRKLVIINGLGRLRPSKWFRVLLKLLIFVNFRSVIVFQNYADYRFYRRCMSRPNIIWVPGSGGKVFGHNKDLKHQNRVAVVTRDSKIPLQIISLQKFQAAFNNLEIVIFGLKNTKSGFRQLRYCDRGFVSRDQLVEECFYHFSPMGYGEGVPHTLVDAICNDLRLIVSRSDFIRYGFYKFSVKYDLVDTFCIVEYNYRLKLALNEKTVNKQYLEALYSVANKGDL